MCCLITIAVLLGPRLGILIWWLVDMSRWSRAFTTFVYPLLGALFLPWTTLAYVLIFPGGVNGFEWAILALGIIFDISAYTGGFRNRRR
jgi:hypothetical protein